MIYDACRACEASLLCATGFKYLSKYVYGCEQCKRHFRANVTLFGLDDAYVDKNCPAGINAVDVDPPVLCKICRGKNKETA